MMYYLIYAGYGPSVCYGASYAETLEEVTEGLYSLCEYSMENLEDIDESLLNITNYNALTGATLSRELVENYCVQFAGSEIRTLLLLSDKDADVKECLIDFVLNGPIDLSDYFDDGDIEDEEPSEVINIKEAVRDLPSLFDKLQEIFEEFSWGD